MSSHRFSAQSPLRNLGAVVGHYASAFLESPKLRRTQYAMNTILSSLHLPRLHYYSKCIVLSYIFLEQVLGKPPLTPQRKSSEEKLAFYKKGLLTEMHTNVTQIAPFVQNTKYLTIKGV